MRFGKVFGWSANTIDKQKIAYDMEDHLNILVHCIVSVLSDSDIYVIMFLKWKIQKYILTDRKSYPKQNLI